MQPIKHTAGSDKNDQNFICMPRQDIKKILISVAGQWFLQSDPLDLHTTYTLCA